MFDINIPHPKYPLTRYSTKQLIAWIETCALFIAICDKQYGDREAYPCGVFARCVILQWQQWDMEDILKKRDVACETINRLTNYVKLDVMS